ncbi:hypothetical protein HYV44_01055 [Candidatus Microgenomates bacterium]|nr:hypothetical protein [Candidatus Microgenomates bacterium]
MVVDIRPNKFVVTATSGRILESLLAEQRWVRLALVSGNVFFQKMKILGAIYWLMGGVKPSDHKYDSARRVFDGWWQGWYFVQYWQNPNGNLMVVCLYENDSKRKANLNYFDNDWNDNWRFAAVRKYIRFPPLWRVLVDSLLDPSTKHTA